MGLSPAQPVAGPAHRACLYIGVSALLPLHTHPHLGDQDANSLSHSLQPSKPGGAGFLPALTR